MHHPLRRIIVGLNRYFDSNFQTKWLVNDNRTYQPSEIILPIWPATEAKTSNITTMTFLVIISSILMKLYRHPVIQLHTSIFNLFKMPGKFHFSRKWKCHSIKFLAHQLWSLDYDLSFDAIPTSHPYFTTYVQHCHIKIVPKITGWFQYHFIECMVLADYHRSITILLPLRWRTFSYVVVSRSTI